MHIKLLEETSTSKGNSSFKDGEQSQINPKAIEESPTPLEPKQLKPEQKPFEEFINDHLIPSLKTGISSKGVKLANLEFKSGPRPVIGGECWFVYGELEPQRRFWLCFSENDLKSTKNISIAESGSEPSLLESFLIDEKKITLELIVSRILQRLNGQKWLGEN